MSAEAIIEMYMAQTGSCFASADHDAHSNGSTHTNSSGSHADSGQVGGGGHGDYSDSYMNN